jgi:ADP-ribose pyrophosphatase YjhB (NUDIX family)
MESSLHPLQQHILHQLILNPCRRYADLKPTDVEGNLFMYHLRQLMQAEIVCKTPLGQYELSSAGKVYADRLSLKSLSPRQQPRIVTLIACSNQAGEWLLYQRLRQPLINTIGFPYGKIHVGETILQAAHRELKEKTGLTAELEHRGDGYISIYQAEQLVSQVMFHFFLGTSPSGRLRSTKVGRPFWSAIEKVSTAQLLPSVPDLLRLQDENQAQRFFAELIYKL